MDRLKKGCKFFRNNPEEFVTYGSKFITLVENLIVEHELLKGKISDTIENKFKDAEASSKP